MTRIQCSECDAFFHSSCSITFNEFQDRNAWIFDTCIRASNPFSTIDDDNLLLTITANDSTYEYLNLHPSFAIQSLLDKLPGDKGDITDDFLTESISSKYYTPSSFSKKLFSMMHINIASLQCHIGDLRTMLSILGHEFDIIAVTETRLNEDIDPIIDINLDGYDFVETRTNAIYGGTGIYIKNGIDYQLKK